MIQNIWFWIVCFEMGSVLVMGAPLLWPHMWPVEGCGIGTA